METTVEVCTVIVCRQVGFRALTLQSAEDFFDTAVNLVSFRDWTAETVARSINPNVEQTHRMLSIPIYGCSTGSDTREVASALEKAAVHYRRKKKTTG